MELRRREHARSVSVVVDHGDRVSVRGERCAFAGGRDDLGNGRGSRLFGGTAGGLAAPDPGRPVGAAEVEERLLDFTARIGGDAVLSHQAVAVGRSVVADGGQAIDRVYTVFALTGEAAAGDGRMLPIGVSGRGTGLDVLADGALADAIVATRAALAAADGPVTGHPPAVLSPQAAAVLVHEAVGHYAEAMHVGAPAVHRLFTRIAGPCLTVVDQADPPGATPDPTPGATPGPLPGATPGNGGVGRHLPDDEGVVSLGATEIVRRGVLVAQLHSRATARAAATTSTGNARAALVWDTPIPRVSNLVCAAGSRPEDDLVGEIDAGVYIHRVADGYRQGTRVSARVVLGEQVRKGRRTGRYFTGSRIDGRLDLLTRLVELGDRAERCPNAMCGKDGQLLFDVGTVAPAMRLSALPLIA